MINTIYVNGCSWSVGDEISTDKKFINYLLENNLKLCEKTNWNILDNNDNLIGSSSDYYSIFNWGGVLKNKLNCQNYINNSLGGGSNHRIFRETLNYIIDYPEHERESLLVVIGWTSADRNEMYFKVNKQWERFNPAQKFSETLDKYKLDIIGNKVIEKYDHFQNDFVDLIFDENERLDSYLKQVYSLSNILENLGIKYYFFEAFTYLGGLLRDIDNVDDFKLWINWFKNNNKILKETNMHNLLKEKNLEFGEFLHPLIDGHNEWGNYLYEKIKNIYNV